MIHQPTLLAVACAVALCAASQAHAISISGTTTGAPTYNRVLTGNPPPGLSGAGTAVRYASSSFTVGATGSYLFLSIAIGGWDNFTSLYQTAFNPAAPLTNALIGNDDYLDNTSNIGVSGFSRSLTAGLNYVYVTTGFANSDFGAFTNSITGPGIVTVAPVPEPATYLTMALGLVAGIGFARRRSAQQRAAAL